MPIAPVERRSLSDAVFGSLREAILRGELSAGESLPAERTLCARFEVNRGALREALKRLEQLGLVVIRQGEPTRVVDFRASSGLEVLPDLLVAGDAETKRAAVQGMSEMRSALGPDIARLAAIRHQPGQLSAIERTLERMREAHAADAGTVALQRVSMELWGEIVMASHNLAYQLMYNTWKTSWEPVQDLMAPALAAEVHSLALYERLYASIAQRKPALAERHARKLLALGAHGIERWLTSMVERKKS